MRGQRSSITKISLPLSAMPWPRSASMSTSDQEPSNLTQNDQIICEEFVRSETRSIITFSSWEIGHLKTSTHLIVFACVLLFNVSLNTSCLRGAILPVYSQDCAEPIITTSLTDTGKLLASFRNVITETFNPTSSWCYHEAISAPSRFAKGIAKLSTGGIGVILEELLNPLEVLRLLKSASFFQHGPQKLISLLPQYHPNLAGEFLLLDPKMIWDALLLLSVAW